MNLFIVIYHSPLVKGAKDAARVCKLLKSVFKKTPQFFFTGQRRNKDHSALVNCRGIKFRSLDRLINDCKLRNERKTFNPNAQ
jgi:hypothetical protein